MTQDNPQQKKPGEMTPRSPGCRDPRPQTLSGADDFFVTADDPAMHSSQNEQDNRRYAKFARIPCLRHPAYLMPALRLAANFSISPSVILRVSLSASSFPRSVLRTWPRKPAPVSCRRASAAR